MWVRQEDIERGIRRTREKESWEEKRRWTEKTQDRGGRNKGTKEERKKKGRGRKEEGRSSIISTREKHVTNEGST